MWFIKSFVKYQRCPGQFALCSFLGITNISGKIARCCFELTKAKYSVLILVCTGSHIQLMI